MCSPETPEGRTALLLTCRRRPGKRVHSTREIGRNTPTPHVSCGCLHVWGRPSLLQGQHPKNASRPFACRAAHGAHLSSGNRTFCRIQSKATLPANFCFALGNMLFSLKISCLRLYGKNSLQFQMNKQADRWHIPHRSLPTW